MAVILTVIKHHCELETPIWVHENVLAFDEKILQDHCSAKWDIIKIKIRPEDPAWIYIYILYRRKPQAEFLLIYYAWTSLCHLFLKMPQGTSHKAQGARAPRHRAQDTGHKAQGTRPRAPRHRAQGTEHQGTWALEHRVPEHRAPGHRAPGHRAPGNRANKEKPSKENSKTIYKK